MAEQTSKPKTFPKLLLRNAAARGADPAIREKSRGVWRTMTWAQFADETEAVAAALMARDLKRGAHVAFLSGNRPRLYVAMAATHWAGAVATPLFEDSPPEEIAPLLQQAGVTHIFAEDQEQVDKALRILPTCPSVRFIIYDKDRGMRHYKQPQLVSYADLLRDGRARLAAQPGATRMEAERGQGEDAAFLFFTSGATGPVRGVVHTHAGLIERAETAAAMDKLTAADLALAYLPPAWIGQSLFSYGQSLATGYCICCPESIETLFTDMREIGPTYFLAPPSVLELLVSRVELRMQDAGAIKRGLYKMFMALARRVGDKILSGRGVFIGSRLAYALGGLVIYGPLKDVLGLSRVRVAYTAGDAVSPAVLGFFRALGVNVKQLYGATETGFFVAMQRDRGVRPDTVGPAAEGVEVKLTPQREILVRSPGLFKEYLRDPQATAAVKTPDGFFHTGDAGRLDDDGHLRLLDRVADIGALANGALFSPGRIENRLRFSPYIKQAAVFGDRRETVCALIDIDTAAVGAWADTHEIAFTGHADLAAREEVSALIAEEIAKANADLAADPSLAGAQVSRFLLLHKELDPDDGALTRMRELRRGVVAARHAPLIEAMHAGRPRVQFDAEVMHEDGSVTTAEVDLRISDAKTFPPAPSMKAA
ncbi:MAG: AMP-binding protein [Hyphomicrobiales bacterium]|nr:AMP-binding protein [Hyphomicrobiales bacterium]